MRPRPTSLTLAAAVLGGLLLSACAGSSSVGGSPGPASSPPGLQADLTVILQPGFIANPTPRTYRLTCRPAGGTVPAPADACARLPAASDLFGPRSPCVAPDTGTEEVVGTFRGRPVDLRFGGCDADREAWQRLARVLGISG